MRWLNLKIGPKIILGLSIAAVLTVIVAVVSIYYLRGVSQRLTTVAEEDRLLQTRVLELQITIEQQNDGVLSYLLSGDQAFLAQFGVARGEYLETSESLRGLVKSDEDIHFLAQLDSLHQDFLGIAQEQITLSQQGFPRSAEFLWRSQGSALKGELSEGLSDFITKHEEAILARVQDARSQQNQALTVSLTLVGLVWVVSLVGGIWISRSITRPIGGLMETAEAIGRGDFRSRALVSGKDELATLGNAINRMAEDLEVSRKTMEELLEQEQRQAQRMRAVMTSAPIVLFAFDGKGIFTLSEGKGLSALGMKPGEVIGKSVFEVYRDVSQIIEDVGRALEGEELSSIVQVGESTFETRYSPIRGQNGEVIGGIGVSTDVTDRKRAEESLIQQARDLAVLGERNRMAREIHDTLAQGFTGIVLQLEAAEQAMGERPNEMVAHLGKARTLARDSLQEARRSVWDLVPRALEHKTLDLALQEAARKFSATWNLKATFTLTGQTRALSSEVESALLRIAQESLTNVRKHAQATEAEISLTFLPQLVALEIRDNGNGAQGSQGPDGIAKGGFGLLSNEQRARRINGIFRVERQEGKGTLVKVTVPLE